MKYLETLYKYNISPNFWCSEQYWKMAEWKEKHAHGQLTKRKWYWVENENGQVMLPVIYDDGEIDPLEPYWAGFSCMDADGNNPDYQHLDYEFIYVPMKYINDANMPGKDWKTTRKNIHKVEREHGKMALLEMPPEYNNDINEILLKWAGEKEIYDPELMVQYLHSDNHRIGVMLNGDFVGVLAWDTNYTHVNFRYCVIEDFPGLSDYARILFRQYVYFKYGGHYLINDGGSLDSPSLYLYKKRLCPKEINNIYSYKNGGDG